jgi:hypothetical protein
MVDESHENSEGGIHIDNMPIKVKLLVDTMLAIDPGFDLTEWLVMKAEEDLTLINADLVRERIQLEQRLKRLETIKSRMAPEDIREFPQGQTNLFDCFDVPDPLKHLTERIENMLDQEPHPAGSFLGLTSDESCDDPLLAVTAQMMIIAAHDKIGTGAKWADLSDLYTPLLENGIDPVECDEALDHLISTGQLHEIDDDCFIPDE